MSSKIKAGPLTLTVTVGQRILLNSVLDVWPATTTGRFRKAGKAMDITELSKDELKAIKYRSVPGTNNPIWDEPKKKHILEFKDREVAHVVRQAAKDLEMIKWPKRNRVEVLDLWKQLDIYQDDDEEETE